MAFYAEHFLEIQDGIVARPAYLSRRWNHALRFSLGSFRVGSHRLRVQTDHHMDRADRLCQLCTLAEIETEHHFIFRCSRYYEIRGRFYCLFRDCSSLSMFFSYIDQRCLALFLQEATHLREITLQSFIPQERTPNQLITAFFSPLSTPRGLKRPFTTSHSRSVRHCTSLSRQRQSYSSSSRHSKALNCSRAYLSITDFFVTRKDP